MINENARIYDIFIIHLTISIRSKNVMISFKQIHKTPSDTVAFLYFHNYIITRMEINFVDILLQVSHRIRKDRLGAIIPDRTYQPVKRYVTKKT